MNSSPIHNCSLLHSHNLCTSSAALFTIPSSANIFKAVQFTVTYTFTILSAATTDPYPTNVFLSLPTAQHYSNAQHSAQKTAIKTHLNTVTRHITHSKTDYRQF